MALLKDFAVSGEYIENLDDKKATIIKVPHYEKFPDPDNEGQEKEKFYEKFANVKEKYEFEGGSYTIKNGDTLAEIAHIFKVSLYELKKANGFIDPKKLIPGRKIIIP